MSNKMHQIGAEWQKSRAPFLLYFGQNMNSLKYQRSTSNITKDRSMESEINNTSTSKISDIK